MIKKLTLFFAILSLFGDTVSFSGIDPSNQFKLGDGSASNKSIVINKGSGATNPAIRWNNSSSVLQFTNDGTNYSSFGSGSGGSAGVNLLTNGDFETGISLGWTASGGTFAAVNSGANLLFGSGSATWTPTGAQDLSTSAYTISHGMDGNTCQAQIYYLGGDANYTLKVLDGSSNVLASTVLAAATVAAPVQLVFPCGASAATVKLRLSASGAAAIIALDQAFLGQKDAIKIGSASLIASGYWPTTTNCIWSRASATLGAFTLDSDCPAATVETNVGPGILSSTAATYPKFTLTALPAGIYKVTMTGYVENSSGSGVLAINDGTTTSGSAGFSTGGAGEAYSLSGVFSYTASGTRTFELFGASSSGQTDVNLNGSLRKQAFTVERYPSTSETAYTFDTTASMWSGYHDSTCSWAFAGSSFADPSDDASCAIVNSASQNFGAVTSYGASKPGITFIPKTAGIYQVTVQGTCAYAANDTPCDLELTDGTTVFGYAHAHSDGSTTGNLKSPFTINAIVPVASISSISLRLKGTIHGWGGSGFTVAAGYQGNEALQWTVVQIGQQMPQPIIPTTAPRSEVWLTGYTGYGSTNTMVPRLSTVQKNIGTGITYATSAAAGDSYTIQETGIYAIRFGTGQRGSTTSAMFIGISVNSAQLTTAIQSITAANRLASQYMVWLNGSWEGTAETNVTLNLTAGDVIRPHTDGNSLVAGGSTDLNSFRITKINN